MKCQYHSAVQLSIVVPCFNEEACVGPFLEAVAKAGIDCPYEVVFVDDGSTDGTLAKVKDAARNAENIRYVSFSRNFGKEAALLAGLGKASGEYVVTIDADLQDPPSLLPEMLEAVRSGEYDCAAAFRPDRNGEPPVRSWFARRFYGVMRRFSDVELVDGARDYRLMSRKVVDAILSMPEVNRFTKGIYQWVGFRTKWFPIEYSRRQTGKSKWSFWRLATYAVDGMLAFSTMPLQAASVLGLTCCLFSFLALAFVIVRKFLCGDPVAGWPSLVCIIIFLGGLQLFFIGVIGMYLAKVYREAKHRPSYFIREEGGAPGA